MFEIHNKIAIVTGGASGLGFRFAEELLRNGIKGLTIADIDCLSGEKAVKNLNRTFGNEKSIFIKTDVSKLNDFEEAYRKTVEKFKNVDILINNAGLTDDTFWERVVSINLLEQYNGMILKSSEQMALD